MPFRHITIPFAWNGNPINPANWYNHKSKTFKKNKRKGL